MRGVLGGSAEGDTRMNAKSRRGNKGGAEENVGANLEEAQDEIFSALRDVLPLLVRKTYVPLNNRAVKLVQNGVEER